MVRSMKRAAFLRRHLLEKPSGRRRSFRKFLPLIEIEAVATCSATF